VNVIGLLSTVSIDDLIFGLGIQPNFFYTVSPSSLEEVKWMPDEQCGVIPYQPWTQNGFASVMPLPPGPGSSSLVLEVENRPAGAMTIKRGDYPLGLIVIPPGTQLTDTTPATLPMKSTRQKKIDLDSGDPAAPNGVVVLFTTR